MRRTVAAAFALVVAATAYGRPGALSCEGQYAKAAESLQPAARVLLRRAWATYAAGYAGSTDEALDALAPLTSNLKVDALARCIQRSLPPPSAVLHVTVSPGGGKSYGGAVRLDGRVAAEVGQVDITAGRGRHIVTASSGGADDQTIAKLVDLREGSNASVTIDEGSAIGVAIDEAPLGGLPDKCTELHLSLTRLNPEGSASTPVMKRFDAVLLAAKGEVQDVTDLFTFGDGTAATMRCGELEQRLQQPAPWQLLVAGRDGAGRALTGVLEVWPYHGLLRGRVVGVYPKRSSLDVIIIRTSDGKQYAGSILENSFTADLPPGEYTITPMQRMNTGEEYQATQTIQFTGERALDFTLKAGPPPEQYVQESQLIRSVSLWFNIDDAGQHFVPTAFSPGRFLLRDLHLASMESVAQSARFESTRPYIVVETYDAQGRFLWRAHMTGGYQHSPLAPLAGMQLGVNLPLARVKSVRVYGRPQEQPADYDVSDLAKLEKKE